ncbi:hypothetical protein N0M98_29075 [Paenibacillus doosanensis]|uniref:hypothetical protein n=1 Tax=Paenibacillus doosanensis TaxID=1229154 RepID=UPI0021802E58|nr:hypothetical protein [Paenibacillus doosanensis]MCS7464160.1 hypothetical protein [Paenibacillus doosanensis]
MSVVKLPQPVGLRIEIARAAGLSDETIIDLIRRKDAETLRRTGPESLPWDILIEHGAERGEELERAIREGYAFTFLTVRGLIHYLLYRFGLKEGADYTRSEGALEGVPLTGAQLSGLRSAIPSFWRISEQPLGEDGQPERAAAGTFRIERLHYEAIRIEGGEAAGA